LANWTSGQTGTIGTATIVCPGNEAPVFTAAPAAANIASTGGTIQFTAVDPDGGTITYSLTTTRSGITINSTTGLVTVTAAAAGTSGNIVVQASDGILTASATCAVTVASESTGSGTVIHNTSFDTDPATAATAPSGYVLSQSSGSGDSRSFVTSGQRSGARSYRMSLARDSASDFRCELAGTSQGNDPMTNANGTCNPIEYWIGYSQRLVAPWPTDTQAEVILQWHAGNTVQGTFEQSVGWDLSPILNQISFSNGYVRVFNRWCDIAPGQAGRPAVGSDCYINGYESRMVAGTLAEYEGIWTDWVWHIVWDWRQTGTPRESTTQANSNWKNTANNGGTGKIEIWNKKAGQTAYTKRVDYTGPTGTKDYYASPLLQGSIYYLKYGLYKSTWRDSASAVSSRSIDFDNVKAIKFGGSFNDVAPAGNP
jgi:hypothetical protein